MTNTIYYLDISKIKKIDYSIMHADQKKKILSFKNVKDKKLCFASEFLKNLFSFKHGFNITYVDNKPVFENQKTFFSISHSGNYCVYIEDDDLIGIDIQEPNIKYNSAFIKKWTLKEAQFKSGLKTGHSKYSKIEKNIICVYSKNLVIKLSFEEIII